MYWIRVIKFGAMNRGCGRCLRRRKWILPAEDVSRAPANHRTTRKDIR